jgi:hypothetical protein
MRRLSQRPLPDGKLPGIRSRELQTRYDQFRLIVMAKSLKERFQQVDIWITSHAIDVL